MSPAIYLIDTSGLFRILQNPLREAWQDEMAAGVIALCPVVEIEFLFSARSLADRLEKQRLLRTVFGWQPMAERAFERAEAVQQLLTETGKHRSAGPVDLLIAATAEQASLTVLSDDRDFGVIAEVTGQRVRMVTDFHPGTPAVRHLGAHPAPDPETADDDLGEFGGSPETA